MAAINTRDITGTSSLKGLRVFCVAAKLASFKEAAAELFITASAVSHQIRSLEQRLGFELFERQTRAVTLTGRGQSLVDSIGPLMDRIYEEVNAAVHAEHRVALKVLLPQFFATELFIPQLSEFKRRHPDIDIYLEMTDSRTDQQSVAADLAVLLTDDPPKERCEELFDLELVPACAPSYNPEENRVLDVDFESSTLIIHRQRREAWNQWFREAGVELQQAPNIFELDSITAVVQSAEQGLGVALVPKTLTASRFESGKLLRLAGNELLTGDKYYLSCQNNTIKSENIGALANWIKEISTEKTS